METIKLSNSVILSVCIPTFNRLQYLKEMLEVLLPQAEALGVEVCVSDNCSSDNTQLFLSEISQSFSCLKHNSNSVNIGMEPNIIQSMKMGQGKYLLPIGDDEVIQHGSLEVILKRLTNSCAEKNELDILFLDGWYTDEQLKPKRRIVSEKLIKRIFDSPLDAFASLWTYQALGCFVINRNALNESKIERYMGLNHSYCCIIWEYLINILEKNTKCNVICTQEPLVLLRVIEKSWSQDYLKIMLHDWPESLERLPRHFDSIKKEVLLKYRKNMTRIPSLVVYRANYNLSDDFISTYMGNYPLFSKIKTKIIVSLPKSLCTLILFLAKVTRKQREILFKNSNQY